MTFENEKNDYRFVFCRDAKTFMNLISPSGESFKRYFYPNMWIFRGQDNADWKLIPRAFREDIPKGIKGFFKPLKADDNKRTNFIQICSEAKALYDFFECADKAVLPIPEDSRELRDELRDFLNVEKKHIYIGKNEWPSKLLWSLLALAAHHGIPTRFLDWTWSSYTAAYFACVNIATNKLSEIPESLAVWAFCVEMSKEFLLEDDNGDRLYLIESPYAHNKNLAAQRGVHMFHMPGNCLEEYFLDAKLDQLSLHNFLVKYNKNSYKKNNFTSVIKFQLPADKAVDLLWELAKMHISAATLFPGYDGVVKNLKEREIWEELR